MAALYIFLAMLLGMSALQKGVDRQRLLSAAARLSGIPAPLGLLPLIVAGVAETIAALCLLIAPFRLVGAIIALVIWMIYAIALLRRYGQSLDCGCDLVARERVIGWSQIARPSVLAVLAGVTILAPQTSFTLDTPFAAAGILALWLGASELLAIPQPAWRNN
jgi:hypothetical protein